MLDKLRRHVRILVDIGRPAGEKADLNRFLDQAVVQIARTVDCEIPAAIIAGVTGSESPSRAIATLPSVATLPLLPSEPGVLIVKKACNVQRLIKMM